MKMKALSQNFLTLFALIVALGCSVTPGQDAKTLERIQGLKTPTIKKNIAVYYSPGHKKRASAIQSLIENAMRFYKDKLNVNIDLNVAILTKEQWEQATQIPYDLPFVSDPPYVVFLPATYGDGVLTAGSKSSKLSVPPAFIQRLRAMGYTYEKGQRENFDFISLHELGHVICERISIAEFPGKPNKWLNEFTATYVAYAYLRAKRPKLALLARIFAEHQLAVMAKQKYSSLEDFEKLYSNVGPENYGWYQSKFIQRAAQVYDTEGLSFIEELRKFPPPGGKTLPVDTVLANLEEVAPGFIAWAKTLR